MLAHWYSQAAVLGVALAVGTSFASRSEPIRACMCVLAAS